MKEIDWTFGGLWPYRPHWFDTPEGRLHYIDEGPRDGRPVVMVHGNPTWGFLYRNFVGPLVDAGYRAIVPDFLGFGRSDKPSDPALYHPVKHARRLNALLDSLDLHGAVVIPQDWGALGMAWAAANPDRVDGLFIMNSSIQNPKEEWKFPLPLKFFRISGIGELLVKGFSMFHRSFLFGVGVVKKERLTKQVRHAYLAPHSTWSSRTGVLEFPRAIPNGPNSAMAPLLIETEKGLEEYFRDRPVKIVWAMNDVAFTPDMIDNLWLQTFPEANVVRLEEAGHYLQEDAYERIVPELLKYLADLS